MLSEGAGEPISSTWSMPAGTADVRCCGFTRSRVPVTGPRGRTALPSDRASILVRCASGARRGLADPAELRPVHPEAVEHDRELPGERRLVALPAPRPGDPQRPGLQRREPPDPEEHHVGRLEQRGPHLGVARLADVAGAVDLAGLVALRRQPEVRADVPGRSEEHTSELQSRQYLVCRLLLAKKKELPGLVVRCGVP